MRYILAMAAALSAAPLAAQPAVSLPGVADEETTIPSGEITRFHRGLNDNLFVLDRAGHWYRLGLNEGCLRGTPRISAVVFDNGAASNRVDRFTRVVVSGPGGTLPVNCRLDSIRRSEAPPQYDSTSPVTRD